MISMQMFPIHEEDLFDRVLNQEAVVVMPDKGQVKVFNEVGTRIWSLADGTRTIQTIAYLISQEFQVDLTVSEQDTSEFIKLLFNRGMVRLLEEPIHLTT